MGTLVVLMRQVLESVLRHLLEEVIRHHLGYWFPERSVSSEDRNLLRKVVAKLAEEYLTISSSSARTSLSSPASPLP